MFDFIKKEPTPHRLSSEEPDEMNRMREPHGAFEDAYQSAVTAYVGKAAPDVILDLIEKAQTAARAIGDNREKVRALGEVDNLNARFHNPHSVQKDASPGGAGNLGEHLKRFLQNRE